MCNYCDIISGKRKAARIYESSKLLAFIPEKPAGIGHIVIVPKKHAAILEELDDYYMEHLFKAANKMAVLLFETLNIEGTNILMCNGVAAGQEEPHAAIHVIARRAGDGMDFTWTPKQLTEEQVGAVEVQLKNELSKPVTESGPKDEDDRMPHIPDPDEQAAVNKVASGAHGTGDPVREESYLIKQLRRMP